MNFIGLLIGLATFMIIGLFHPIVIKAEFYFGTRSWWAFLAAGILFAVLSVIVTDVTISTFFGVISFSSFWGILELFEQKERVRKGWFPKGPGHDR